MIIPGCGKCTEFQHSEEHFGSIYMELRTFRPIYPDWLLDLDRESVMVNYILNSMYLEIRSKKVYFCLQRGTMYLHEGTPSKQLRLSCACRYDAPQGYPWTPNSCVKHRPAKFPQSFVLRWRVL